MNHAENPDTGQRANQLFTVAITVAEATAAFAVIARMGRISKRIRDRTFDWYMKTISVYFQLVPVTADLITLAAHLTQSYPLKGYDAVQVAAALRLQRTLGPDRALVFVAGDETVITAAQSEGLTVDNPFWHVEENETDRSLHDR